MMIVAIVIGGSRRHLGPHRPVHEALSLQAFAILLEEGAEIVRILRHIPFEVRLAVLCYFTYHPPPKFWAPKTISVKGSIIVRH